tara:strand:- start:4643 stop:4867 length:225 start_codon:yes stop_codon:yes gene_type:complete
MKSTKLEILNIIMGDLLDRGQVTPVVDGYQYNDVLSVIKGLKDVGAVSVTPRAIKLLNRDSLDQKLELLERCYF